MTVLLNNLVLMEKSGIWGILNKQDRRILITYSSNIMVGVANTMSHMYYSSIKCKKELLEDYKKGCLSIVLLEETQRMKKNEPFAEMLKQQYMDQYSSEGYFLYNKHSSNKMFIGTSVVSQSSLDGNRSELSVFVCLKKKNERVNVNKHQVIGVFKTFKDAKSWCKEFYGRYESECAKALIICNNEHTRKFFNNPVVQDARLREAYMKLFKQTGRK